MEKGARKVVHLQVYRGKSLNYDKAGNITTEGSLIKLLYGDLQYYNFLRSLRANGCIFEDGKASSGLKKVFQVKWNGEENREDAEEVTDAKTLNAIREELDRYYDLPKAELTPDQQRIADLEAKVAALTAGGIGEEDLIREEYERVIGKKPAASKKLEAMKQEIADKKAEDPGKNW